jgi:hypothetical protein
MSLGRRWTDKAAVLGGGFAGGIALLISILKKCGVL